MSIKLLIIILNLKKHRDIAEYTEWLNSLYDATEPLANAQDDAEEYTDKLNNMRNVIEETMETLFTYDGLYNSINQTLVQARGFCNEIKIIGKEVNESIGEGRKFKEETRGFVIDMQNNFQVRMSNSSSILENLRTSSELRNTVVHFIKYCTQV